MKTIRIKFVDFTSSPGSLRNIKALISQFYELDETDNPDWIVYSVFGQEHLKYNNCVKIFWTGENQAPDFNLCDYALAFEHIELGDRYLRLPLWLLYRNDIERLKVKHSYPTQRQRFILLVRLFQLQRCAGTRTVVRPSLSLPNGLFRRTLS